MLLELDLVQTLTLGCLSLLLGMGLVRLLPILARYNLPPPVIGGLVVAAVSWFLHAGELATLSFDTSLQGPMMTAFFTAIGFGASVDLLRRGGTQMLLFLALAALLGLLQSAAGVLVAVGFGQAPILGVLMGTATMAGGPATGLAFAPLFEQAGVAGAEGLAIASAMAGIVLGGLLGGPLATRLMQRHGLQGGVAGVSQAAAASANPVDEEEGSLRNTVHALTTLLLAMWLGQGLGAWWSSAGVTLPGYVGAMLVGALWRNLSDATGWVRPPMPALSRIGTLCLTLFLAVALMNLKLWELAALALPLLVNLVMQAIMVWLFAGWVLFRLVGRDYDAAVMCGGFSGFMLGTTANAMAVMRTLEDRYGLAPRAFLVVPVVGAFFIDFTNALTITAFLNLLD
ncbi:MAG: sodium/glutamate symporter [Steroidobacteraceae bacterium]